MRYARTNRSRLAWAEGFTFFEYCDNETVPSHRRLKIGKILLFPKEFGAARLTLVKVFLVHGVVARAREHLAIPQLYANPGK